MSVPRPGKVATDDPRISIPWCIWSPSRIRRVSILGPDWAAVDPHL